MRVTVGTLLLGLGGCASATDPTGGCKPPHCHVNPGPEDAKLGKPEPTADTAGANGELTPPKQPETPPKQPETPPKQPETPPKQPETPPDNGGCEPPHCHINPGPNDDPGKPKPKPQPEPPREPKRVNTGPMG